MILTGIAFFLSFIFFIIGIFYIKNTIKFKIEGIKVLGTLSSYKSDLSKHGINIYTPIYTFMIDNKKLTESLTEVQSFKPILNQKDNLIYHDNKGIIKNNFMGLYFYAFINIFFSSLFGLLSVKLFELSNMS